MGLIMILKKFVPDFLLAEIRKRRPKRIENFSFDGSLDVKKDIQDKYGHRGDLLDLFAGNKNFIVHKWHHYIPLYERYFSAFRGREIRFLEIGVSKGGSLQMWRRYFGDQAIIYGIDVDPECAKFNGLAAQVRIGSQADAKFLEAVIAEMGGLDLVLDDGSHHMQHIRTSLKVLFPHLSDGGLYMIEDLHTSYWKEFGGGYRSKANFFSYVRDLVDDLHHWYHGNGMKQSDVSASCSGIHIHDSLVVLEKNRVYQPVHSQNR
jgi:hypothetical protein